MRRTPIILLSILLIILIIVGYLTMNPDLARGILVDFGLAEPVVEGYVVTGLLEAPTAYIGCVNGGRILELPVAVGDRVSQGLTVATLDTTLMEPLLEAAQARHESALAQLNLLRAPPRDVDLVLVKAGISHAHALYDSAVQALEDVRDFAPETIRDEQITLSQTLVDQAQAGLDLAQSHLDALEEGATASQIKSVEVLVAAAETEVLIEQSKIDDQLIKAPFDGVIVDLFMLVGELSLPGQRIVAIADLDTLELSIYMPEADLGWAKLGDEVKLHFDAYPDREFTGKVTFIADQAEFTPRNVQTPEERVILVYEIRIQVPNSEGDLKPGLPAEVSFGGSS